MIKFLIQRPIAVLMSYLALIIVGCVTFFTLPVSLLPDIDVPEIIVRVNSPLMTARSVENGLVAPLRRELMQLKGLEDIESEAIAGMGTIRLKLEYGVDTDLAYIEANERVDASMANFPKDVARPEVIKRSVSDIPICYLQLTDNGDSIDTGTESAYNILRRRLEQLPEISLVDITGIPQKEISIIPDYDKLHSIGVSSNDIENVLLSNNVELGNVTIRDGYYEYQVNVSTRIKDAADVADLFLMKDGHMHRLGDICQVSYINSRPNGYSRFNGKDAVTLAVIKNASSGLGDLDKALDSALQDFSEQYPEINVNKTRDQSQFLSYSISNLEQNLILGLVLVFILCAVFMRNWRMPVIIGFTVIVAVIITFLLFFLFKFSLNIISLAGLILAVGMMIDNSVIVAENIEQHFRKTGDIYLSCIRGTNEMITPLLSSSLTTIAVFLPLIFVSGIAGAIFADQAFAITAGLFSSYIVGITLLPVLFCVLGKRMKLKREEKESALNRWLLNGYDKGYELVYNNKRGSVLFVIIILASVVPLFHLLKIERLPHIDSNETILSIDWNENVNLDENLERISLLTDTINDAEKSAFVGRQDFMLGNLGKNTESQAEIYLKATGSEELGRIQTALESNLKQHYSEAEIEFKEAENPFEQIFSDDEPILEARINLKRSPDLMINDVIGISDSIQSIVGEIVTPPSIDKSIEFDINIERASLYGISKADIQNIITSQFKGRNITSLNLSSTYVPINLAMEESDMNNFVNNSFVFGSKYDKDLGYRQEIPLSALVKPHADHKLKKITASSFGEYLAYDIPVTENEAEKSIDDIKTNLQSDSIEDITFIGSYFSNKELMTQLAVVLLISLILMYFILCAQFESFVQPLIVLIEIPIDIAFAFLSLLICGESLNLMSAIGIIVTCGIVVNDSILKLDSINQLRKQGMPLLDAIHTAGCRRLKPIVMTSLTTILAMVPVLFTSDIGSELQRPLAISLIGSMIAGTIISIFVIPLFYYLIYRNKNESTK